MAKSKKYIPPAFDGASSRHININYQLLSSPAFLSCSNNARLLYICMRAEQYGVNENQHPDKDNTKFVFTIQQYRDKYNLTSNAESFRKTRDELIEKGFIKCIEDNSHIRKANIYQYSDMWKHYDDSKNINYTIATKSMKNKLYTKTEKKKKQKEGAPSNSLLNDDKFRAMFQ